MPDYLSGLKLTPSPAGSIQPMTFVCVDGTQGDFLCRQATANGDFPIGVAQVGLNLAPNLVDTITGGDATYTQVAGGPGQEIQIFSGGDVCPVRLGTGGITAGQLVTNDSSGLGVNIAAFTASRWMGGIALQSGAAGEIVEIYLCPGKC